MQSLNLTFCFLSVFTHHTRCFFIFYIIFNCQSRKECEAGWTRVKALSNGIPKLTLKQLINYLRFEMLNLEIVGGTNTREVKMN